jgi:CheY-like chemotaxis protein
VTFEELNPAARVVLVVDDADDCIATLDLALAALDGIAVRGAPSAEEALAVLDFGTVSAVITDVQLPGMTGLELISRLRGQPRFRNLPILAISADANPATPTAALRAGANAFFAKPFSPGAVRRKLEELIHATSSAG